MYVVHHLRVTKNLLYREKSSGQSNMLIFGKHEPWGKPQLNKAELFCVDSLYFGHGHYKTVQILSVMCREAFLFVGGKGYEEPVPKLII
jgi:hypothetical protein